ncbi:beta-ketothiolase BktB [Aquisediminimonas sediminicola]|uniref:beta-ketothiolase BktB n=1 Tax=Alteraquisediminimonas sediminicola TaxID=2676787 RepID=UPI001C8D4998|nr:beta-ketothiolase BktB [Aquisediminimonas sediminicola]
MQDVFIVGAARTAIGTFGGSLKGLMPAELGTVAAKAAIARAGVNPADIDNSVFGQVGPTEAHDAYLARRIGLAAGLPDTGIAHSVNRLCGSGAQAIVTATQMIQLGESDISLAGGAESMSNAPMVVNGMRWGTKMGNATVVDWLNATLHDPWGNGHMGCTGENVAARYGISRERQDAYSVESQRRAGAAIAEGRFKDQIAPIELKTRKGVVQFDTDEHPRPQTTMEDLAALKPVFRKENGTVTAGNASGLNDAGAAVVLASGDAVKAKGLTPIARIVASAAAGVAPDVMGLGPVEAVPIALKRAGLTVADMDVIESNEAFAVQSIAVADALGFDPAKVNPNGGAVALGHPLGATGALLTVKAIYELKRIGGRYGLITMCIGGGQGIALIIENV